MKFTCRLGPDGDERGIQVVVRGVHRVDVVEEGWRDGGGRNGRWGKEMEGLGEPGDGKRYGIRASLEKYRCRCRKGMD